tara:strand:- start:133 stop:639 length:507 start_codon:yes stop_codon:yes gene_type:complete
MANGNSHNAIDELMFLNELQQIGKPSTGNLSDIVGSIGPTPFIETEKGQDLLLNLVMGSPGGAIGRVSKAAITGGQYATGTLRKGLQDWLKRNVPKGKFPEGMMRKSDIMPKSPGKRYKDISDFKWDNKINAARLRSEQAFDKYKIPHESEMADPITILLDILKNRKN